MLSKEKEHLNQVASLGCVVCGNFAEIHHVRLGSGLAKKASAYLSIPICASHHRTGGLGVAFHAGRKVWEEKYGSQIELLEKVYKRLKLPFPPKELTELLEKQKVGYRIGFKTDAKASP